MRKHLAHKIQEYDSELLALTHWAFSGVIWLTMDLVYLLFRIPREQRTLKHAERYLVFTTLTLVTLIVVSQFAWPVGWVVLVLGNLRILQIISLNLSTLFFDATPITSADAAKRARWHFVAIGFSFLDTVLIFGFMYQFFDRTFTILNQQDHEFFHYLYFAVLTLTTIGYGDIHPVTDLGRVLVMYEGVITLMFLLVFVSGALSRYNNRGN